MCFLFDVQGVETIVKALKSGSVSQNDVDRAKSQLRVAYLKNNDTSSGRFEGLHSQILRGGDSQDTLDAINQISVADVNAVSNRFSYICL